VVVLGVVVPATWLVVQVLAPGDGVDPGWVAVERGDLVRTVEVTGRLASEGSRDLGPPAVPEVWDFKLTWLAPEGETVEEGDPVLRFDTADLERRLLERRNEAERAEKEIEKLEADVRRERADQELELAEAEARVRRARLAVDVPEEFVQANELARSRLDLQEAEIAIEYTRAGIEAARRASEARRAVLVGRRDRARRQVREIEDAIERMTVRAPRRGTVIHVANWRDEKKKVGDSVWRHDDVVELPDLDRMMGKGEIDEADAGQVQAGQPVRIRLDAHPELAYEARVDFVWRTVKRKSWRTPEKVFRLDLALETTDRERMRPGMRFRGEVEIDRRSDRVLIPLEAVLPGSEGPAVLRRTVLGHEWVAVTLGERGRDRVEVLDGLSPGDRVASRPAALEDAS
jgi:hypothetical protein